MLSIVSFFTCYEFLHVWFFVTMLDYFAGFSINDIVLTTLAVIMRN